jgi:hypothetical protein
MSPRRPRPPHRGPLGLRRAGGGRHGPADTRARTGSRPRAARGSTGDRGSFDRHRPNPSSRGGGRVNTSTCPESDTPPGEHDADTKPATATAPTSDNPPLVTPGRAETAAPEGSATLTKGGGRYRCCCPPMATATAGTKGPFRQERQQRPPRKQDLPIHRRGGEKVPKSSSLLSSPS